MTQRTSTTSDATDFETAERRYGSIDVEAGDPSGGEAPLAEAGRRTADTAGQLAERAANTGIQQVDHGREQAAQGLAQFADTMRRASGELSDQQPLVQNITQAVAEQTERAASYLRETDARQIVRNVEEIARRQPLIFLGGAFLVGLVGARVLKMAAGQDGGTTDDARPRRQAGTYGYGYARPDPGIAPAGTTEI